MSDRTVWRFLLEVSAISCPLSIPATATVVHVAMVPGTTKRVIGLWVDVDPTEERTERRFYITGTGHPVNTVWQHVGSVIDGQFVWHVWESPATQEPTGDPQR